MPLHALTVRLKTCAYMAIAGLNAPTGLSEEKYVYIGAPGRSAAVALARVGASPLESGASKYPALDSCANVAAVPCQNDRLLHARASSSNVAGGTLVNPF